jgi:hypothetical protein
MSIDTTNVDSLTQVKPEEINKLKRSVFNKHKSILSVRHELANLAVIGKYDENDFYATLSLDGDSQEIRDVISVLEKRFNAASDLEALLSRKSRLVKLKNKPNYKLTRIQEEALDDVMTKISEASKVLSSLPDAGCTEEEWKELDVKRIGKPPRALEQDLIREKLDMDNALGELNRIEIHLGMQPSNISSLSKEESTFSLNAGRRSLPPSVQEVEDLDQEYRRIQGLYRQDEAKPESAFVSGKVGRKSKSKQERLEAYQDRLDSLNNEIAKKEAGLKGVDLIERKKKVIEREKRYAKSESRKADYNRFTHIAKSLKELQMSMQDELNSGSMNENEVHDYTISALNSIMEGDLFERKVIESQPNNSLDEQANIDDIMSKVLSAMDI